MIRFVGLLTLIFCFLPGAHGVTPQQQQFFTQLSSVFAQPYASIANAAQATNAVAQYLEPRMKAYCLASSDQKIFISVAQQSLAVLRAQPINQDQWMFAGFCLRWIAQVETERVTSEQMVSFARGLVTFFKQQPTAQQNVMFEPLIASLKQAYEDYQEYKKRSVEKLAPAVTAQRNNVVAAAATVAQQSRQNDGNIIYDRAANRIRNALIFYQDYPVITLGMTVASIALLCVVVGHYMSNRAESELSRAQSQLKRLGALAENNKLALLNEKNITRDSVHMAAQADVRRAVYSAEIEKLQEWHRKTPVLAATAMRDQVVTTIANMVTGDSLISEAAKNDLLTKINAMQLPGESASAVNKTAKSA